MFVWGKEHWKGESRRKTERGVAPSGDGWRGRGGERALGVGCKAGEEAVEEGSSDGEGMCW